MNIEKTAKTLQGLQTVDTVAKKLNISRRTAVNIIWRLRKQGLVETGSNKRKIRIYRIRSVKKPEIGYKGMYEIINDNSKVKIFTKQSHIIHDHKLSIEETIVRAVKEKDFRTILASLGLFNKVKNWQRLAGFAQKESVTRKIGALYDVARTIIKARRMDKRTRKALLKGKLKNRYIINRIKSRDLRDIEKEWNVFIPFNKADLEVYKE